MVVVVVVVVRGNSSFTNNRVFMCMCIVMINVDKVTVCPILLYVYK